MNVSLADELAEVPTLTVYEKPTCTTCRKLHALLTERGVDFDTVEYHVTGLTEDILNDNADKS